ncbi:HSP20 family protein [Desulfitispora alkaliphila]|uniref:Hsp20/alpha crystallin family protein n=1 Tax=Desulfitispora alkaliphila TaxID=622674 RepID=UPI003D240C57
MSEWNPLKEINNFSKDVNSLLEKSPFSMFYGQGTPRVDIYQTEDDVILKAELPGVAKDDLDVFVDDEFIKLSGETRKSSEINDEHIYKTERYFGTFSRTIPLPVEVKSEEARAEYRDGILSITVPKSEAAKRKGRKINID